jgi:uncharacterized Tic20 family protein
LRLTIPLGSGDVLEVWDDRVMAARVAYPFDDWFGARVIADPRAPLTVDPPLALALVTHGGLWASYVPVNEVGTMAAITAIVEACRALKLEPIGIEESVRLPEVVGIPQVTMRVAAVAPHPNSVPAAPPPAPASIAKPVSRARPTPLLAGLMGLGQPPVRSPQQSAREENLAIGKPGFSDAEALMMAIAHMSMFFLPVVLPVVIWRTLEQSSPAVASQARKTAVFQGAFWALALAVLIYSIGQAISHGWELASALGFVVFAVLLAVAAIIASRAAREAMATRNFN